MARRLGQRADQAVENGHHAGDQVLGGQQAARIDAERGECERVFLHGVTLVFKEHHHHGDAEQGLGQRAEHVSRVAENFRVGADELASGHEPAPQGEGEGEHAEGDRAALVRIEVKAQRAIEQKGGDAKLEPDVRRRRQFIDEYAVDGVALEAPQCKADSGGDNGCVVPVKAEALPDQAGRYEQAQPHGHNQDGAGQVHGGGGLVIGVPGVESEVQRVGAPTELPGAEVGLAALLVEVSEDEEQQQGHNPREDDHIRG